MSAPRSLSTTNVQEGCVLLFDKPYTWTSFQVVKYVRKALEHRFNLNHLKVGHAGTLDPLATGVLIICTGKATKRIDQLQAGVKEYIATLKLGATTPSFDREHEEDTHYPTGHITHELVEQALQQFIGTIQQVPPVHSAVHVDGKRAYKLARKGVEVELKAKTLTIDELELLECQLPESITLRVVCSKGTYIRALARDIGQALQSGAYLTALQRTRVGDYRLNDCHQLSELDEMMDEMTI